MRGGKMKGHLTLYVETTSTYVTFVPSLMLIGLVEFEM